MTQPPESQTTPKSARTARTTKWVAIGLCLAAVGAGLIYLAQPATFTPDCGPPTLVLGTTKFRIEPIEPAADGSLAVPADNPDIAYWVEGANTNYVFALSPTPNNLALETSVKTGDEAAITWTNCNSTTYILSTPKPGRPNDPALRDQSAPGITVFVQTGPSAGGFVVRGDLVEEHLIVINTPDASGIQAEVSLLETSTSSDRTTITVGVSILNTGATAFTVSAGDVSLTPEGAAPLAPASAEPSLQREIKPGASETFYFTFPRPSSGSAVFNVFDIEFDLEDF